MWSILLFFLPGILIFIEFIAFCFRGKRLLHPLLLAIAEIGCLICLPLFYANFGKENKCCADELGTAAFSPKHQLSIGVIVILCLVAYGYSKFRNRLLPPLPEVLLNVFLVIAVVLNIVISFHTTDALFFFFGPFPIILLFILMLAKNEQLFIVYNSSEQQLSSGLASLAWKILLLNPFTKYPVLIILALPVLIVIITILLLFGQKPDSVVRAFTDTYKHGLSQWDYKCDNVNCGGHYLCSVAANGHKEIVKPVRIGKRNGNYIICNRQLLISNAFEELIQERFPFIHKKIRNQYNKVGSMVHKHYWLFNNKYLSDTVYFLMKPLELFFIVCLYTFDTKPESRIARQYLK